MSARCLHAGAWPSLRSLPRRRCATAANLWSTDHLVLLNCSVSIEHKHDELGESAEHKQRAEKYW